MDLSNTRLGGRYLLGPVIGTGGMSDVYAATDELLGRDIAVKMMRADLARDETFLERFRREAQNAAKLNHHAIVAVYDTGQTDDASGHVPYIVMERVHGQTLRDIVRDNGPLPLEEASRVMAEVCRALGFSHEAGIIHRDVKPANIMITNTGAVKVMDFGIARALSDTTSAMTQTAAVIGTAQYLSPEQARGRSAEARSDIYAAGCVYYEVTTGRPPFSGESPFSVAFQHVQDAPTPPSQVPGMDLDPDPALALDAVTLTAMAKDPSDRYDSSADMAADLERIANGRMPLAAQAYADIPEDAPTSHMAAAPVAAGAAGAAAGAGAAGAAAAQGPPPEQEPDPEERKEKKPRRGWVTALAVIAVLALIGAGSFAAWNWINDDDSSGEQQVAEQVNIPDVSDMSRSEAETELRNAGFEVTVEERADAEIERDQVIATEPAADSSVPEGSSVTLLVSSGKEITEVPDLSGLTTEQAQAALSDANLRLRSNVSEQASDEVEVGQIMEQTHASGSQVTVGTEVGITVSTGPEDVRVPTVVGQSMDDATENLESAGFEVEVNMVDSTEPENRVLSATNEGSRQPPGSTVTLEVSRGNQFEMPQLVGKDYEEVFSDLQNAGWRGSPDRLERDNVNQLDPRAVDRVVGQSAREGETIDRNAPITVRVNVLGIP
ncbi:MAG: Stk1 family PASTA domain-containing Ser/Thr kinase [Corynebacterium sp.]|uniref:Stk1 family PASTA domain-containing Ser/Thr kinase n=1 Tax=Corynebacterium sp. TaxID=1720 RepID=UPI003F9976D9